MVKAILFDFDGVLTIDKTGSQSIINYIGSHSKVDINKFKQIYYKYNNGLLYGEYTHKDIWDNLCNNINFDLDFHLLNEAFINTKLDIEMILFLQELKKHYKIGMVTDNKKDRIHAIMEYNNLSNYFDVISISADYKSGKDKKHIFDETVKKLNVDYNECIFIDNSPKNLVVPKKYGMKTILFDDETRDVESFKRGLQVILKR